MKIGVFSTFMSPLATSGMIRDFGRRAEDMGLASIWMGEPSRCSTRTHSDIPVPRTGVSRFRRAAACWT